MIRRPAGSARWVALMALALVAACGERPQPGGDGPPSSSAAESTLQVADAEGRTVALPAPARRVVSLVPSITSTVVALGAGDRLVGRTDFDTEAAVLELPTVGGGLGPDLESLAALDPDLVIRFAGESDHATPDRLDDLGIPHLAVRPDRVADVFTIVEWVGRLLALDDEAAELNARLQGELDAVRAEVSGRAPVQAAWLMGGSPPWTAGEGTYIDELITLAGGVNALGDVGALYGAVSPEVVATREIEVVLLSEGAEVDARLLEGRRVVRLPSSVQQPGPGLGDAARAVADALHGVDRP
ncbi:helical backbone metal receptor [Gaopeijia maritima]|uniref:ABC transporter substrate-binding protein n=1 Tax=Gaopeijia maritima TaxID=3119007 RepID=UPI00325557D7